MVHQPIYFYGLFHLDDSKSLHGKWLEITKLPLKNTCWRIWNMSCEIKMTTASVAMLVFRMVILPMKKEEWNRCWTDVMKDHQCARKCRRNLSFFFGTNHPRYLNSKMITRKNAIVFVLVRFKVSFYYNWPIVDLAHLFQERVEKKHQQNTNCFFRQTTNDWGCGGFQFRYLGLWTFTFVALGVAWLGRTRSY